MARVSSGSSAGIVLAVSGGPDSLALMRVADIYRRHVGACAPAIAIATVDHHLRPESTNEAAFVAALAARWGFHHTTLHWQGFDGAGNLSAKAREARYALLRDHARIHGAGLILTAHHRGDDIETHGLAVARGAGLGGRAGMRALRWLAPDIGLGRPFLAFEKSALAAVVAAAGLQPIDDPTNRDLRYDRARIRQRLAQDPARRAALARRLSRSKAARERGEAALAALLRSLEADGRLRYETDGAITLDRTVLSTLSRRCAAHLISRAIVAAAGGDTPPAGPAVAAILDWLLAGNPTPLQRSLGGALLACDNGRLTLMREFGRSGIPPVFLATSVPLGAGARIAAMEDCDLRGSVAPDQTKLQGRVLPMAWPVSFDGRFVVDVGPWRTHAGARIVALGSLKRGNARDRCRPVVIDAAGTPLAAEALIARRLGLKAAPLVMRSLTRHLLLRDLPV
ncbi:tRNA lysidine(34) synthetase TilS [Jiella sp. MQZ9-1]|uniref:tRNA(Ile)-lysidine synthase n=1 Tax=Jiella flava TaxID=2816857 RepID=A0A939JY53_9HYPH|nr:tRNA lysidine(34) synthetase TilS [Jiella flava]MBO0664056.1 tRNA lysidine(34) synthetase TilS [Jiella flava]MCD2472628.1 tRNA lysidine(34) synthetase TilS [Jiella flava]